MSKTRLGLDLFDSFGQIKRLSCDGDAAGNQSQILVL